MVKYLQILPLCLHSFKDNLKVYKHHICSSLRKVHNTEQKVDNYKITNDSGETKSLNENSASEDLKNFLSEYECPICFDVMASPKRIYACSNGNHFICSLCLFDTKMSCCPSCREDFTMSKPLIQHTTERILERLMRQIFSHPHHLVSYQLKKTK